MLRISTQFEITCHTAGFLKLSATFYTGFFKSLGLNWINRPSCKTMFGSSIIRRMTQLNLGKITMSYR